MLAAVAGEISSAAAAASVTFLNHSSVAVLLVNSGVRQVRRAGKILKSLPTCHLNKQSLVPMFR